MQVATIAGLLRLLVASALGCGAHAAERRLNEPQIKALFLFNFAQFVEWPREAFAGPDAPLCLGVLGDNAVAEALIAATSGEKVAQHPLQVVQGRSVDAVQHCHVVFVGRAESGRLDDILAALKGKPVLTVGDTADSAQRGCILNFYRDGEKVRFELNRQAAKAAELKPAAQLVRLAKLVGPAP